jgi:hypothetical protein
MRENGKGKESRNCKEVKNIGLEAIWKFGRVGRSMFLDLVLRNL